MKISDSILDNYNHTMNKLRMAKNTAAGDLLARIDNTIKMLQFLAMVTLSGDITPDQFNDFINSVNI